MATPSERVGANVRHALSNAGRTQRELAETLGLHQPGISRRLAGRTPFNVDELATVATFLGVDVATLVEDGDGR